MAVPANSPAPVKPALPASGPSCAVCRHPQFKGIAKPVAGCRFSLFFIFCGQCGAVAGIIESTSAAALVNDLTKEVRKWKPKAK